MTFEDAQAALDSAIAADTASKSPEAPSSAVETGATTDSQGQTPGEYQADSFTNVDPSTLPPELQVIYKNMQGDYTRKTQAVAPYLKLQEQYGPEFDPSRVEQSLEFVTALETDPDFARAVYDQLHSVLDEAGLLEAAAEAGLVPEAGSLDDQFVDEESPLAREVQELKAWKAEQENHAQEQALAAHIQRQEMALREENPSWGDSDWDAVYQLAFAHGGDLFAAGQTYEALQTRLLENYIQKKADVPSGVSTVVGGQYAAPPAEGFGEDLNAAHKAAMEHLRNVLGD